MTGHQATAIEVPEQGSIEWYLKYSGGFVRDLIQTIQHADRSNRERLRRGFPQVVAAIEMDSWYKAPAGFAPEYNAPRPGGPVMSEATQQAAGTERLLDAVIEVPRDRDAAMEKYGNHTQTCPASIQPFNETPCECGWREAYPGIDQARIAAALARVKEAPHG